MKKLILIVLASFSLNAVASPTAFVNVNVVPMTTETVIAGQTVIVSDGIIATIADVEGVPVPKDAIVIDGTDRYLIPGLAEMHAHVPGAGSPELGRVLTLFAANGVTLMRGMLGNSSHLALRQRLLDNEVFGPRLVTSGPSMNGNSVNGAADAAQKVRAQHAAGYDFIKIHPGPTSAEYEAIAKTANEIGMPFAGHVPVAVGVENALAAQMATIDHLDGYLVALLPPDSDPSGGYGGFFDVLLADELIEERITEIASLTAASNTWNVPTQSLIEHRVSALTAIELSNRPEMRYMPRATIAQWIRRKQAQENERGYTAEVGAQAIRVRRKLIFEMHKAGAGLLLGSDAPQVFNVPGFSIHDELGYLVAAGLTPFEALRTGTTAVAEFLGSNTGAVVANRAADLVLLDANPLEDIANTRRIHGVMLRGTWYSSHELERRLAVYLERDD